MKSVIIIFSRNLHAKRFGIHSKMIKIKNHFFDLVHTRCGITMKINIFNFFSRTLPIKLYLNVHRPSSGSCFNSVIISISKIARINLFDYSFLVWNFGIWLPPSRPFSFSQSFKDLKKNNLLKFLFGARGVSI